MKDGIQAKIAKDALAAEALAGLTAGQCAIPAFVNRGQVVAVPLGSLWIAVEGRTFGVERAAIQGATALAGTVEAGFAFETRVAVTKRAVLDWNRRVTVALGAVRIA